MIAGAYWSLPNRCTFIRAIRATVALRNTMRHVERFFVISAVAVLGGLMTALPLPAVERGAWFWYQSSDPHGAANVVGNPAAEDEAVAFLQRWEVTRLYGSYSNLPATSPGVLGAWNKKLSLAGIDSYVVLSDANLVLPANQANLQNLVTTRFVNYNDARSDPAERFVGIELDLEPHTLPAWDGGTNEDRRDLLLNLRDAYATVRGQLTMGGYSSAVVSAALPVWFDSSSSIGWSSSAERDQWFADIAGSLDAISLMAYETSSVAAILSSTSHEGATFSGETAIALRSKLGDEWNDYEDFAVAVASVESQIGAGIDIESYYRLRQIAPNPQLDGDFNDDGIVDAADYVAWRKGGALQNDATPGVSSADQTAWRQAFGAHQAGAAAVVPEVASATYAAVMVLVLASAVRRRRPAPL